jgi:16S rRNA G966 N2-methylase RsmD
MDSYEVLNLFSDRKKIFDLIFIDPPYLKNMIPPALEIIYKKNLLSKDGLIVTKIDSSEIIYEGYENLQLCDNRKYGNTTVCFYRYKED